jgi:hypothetical protein
LIIFFNDQLIFFTDRARRGEFPVTDAEIVANTSKFLMGQAAGAIKDVKPAAVIMREMVAEAVEILMANQRKVVRDVPVAKL